MKKLLLIVNPIAGKGAYRFHLSDILYIFHCAGWQTTVAFTSAHGDPVRIVQEQASAYDRVVCMGGDGTLGETVNGFMALGARPELGYIPMGTVNDCATTLGLGRDPVHAAHIIAEGKTMPLDIGSCNGRYFTYVAAFGAFTEVCYETPQDQKNVLGRLAYILDGMNRLANLTHRWTRVEYDNGVAEGDYILCAVTNSRSIAGLIRLRDVAGISLRDGLFEIILIKTPENILQLSPIISDILTNNFSSEYVTLLRSSRVKFTFREPVAWTLDGEDGGSHSQVLCENIHAAIPMIVNKDLI